MKRDGMRTCETCNQSKPLRQIKRINGFKICLDCIRKKRKEHREFLKRKVCGIRKREDMIKESKERKLREQKKVKAFFPKIKGAKNIQISKQFHLYLTSDEKKVLYFKALKTMSSEEANEKVKSLGLRMNKLVVKLRQEIKGEKDLNKRFKEEFAKMCEELK